MERRLFTRILPTPVNAYEGGVPLYVVFGNGLSNICSITVCDC